MQRKRGGQQRPARRVQRHQKKAVPLRREWAFPGKPRREKFADGRRQGILDRRQADQQYRSCGGRFPGGKSGIPQGEHGHPVAVEFHFPDGFFRLFPRQKELQRPHAQIHKHSPRKKDPWRDGRIDRHVIGLPAGQPSVADEKYHQPRQTGIEGKIPDRQPQERAFSLPRKGQPHRQQCPRQGSRQLGSHRQRRQKKHQ